MLMAAPSGSSQVQTVPCWQEIVQATVVLPVLLSQQAFLLLMFLVRARIGLPARGEQPAAFRVSPKLDAGTVAQMHQRSVYLNAVWVKNEWSRYLALMRTDRSRLLIPCYRDMDPYDMPEELSMLQSQDMGKIGFIQDLIRGVKKVVDAAKPQETAAETVKETVVVHNEGGSNVQALLDRGQMALEDGEWSKADEFFEQVLNQDAKCGAAYLGKFLARVECRSAKTYADAYIENVKADAPNEKNADACEPDEAFITSCVEKYTVPGILSGNQICQMLEFDLEYCEASSLYALRAEEAQEEFAADKDLMRAVKYASREAKMITENIPQALDKLHADAQKREDAEKARITAEYRKFLTETEAKLEKEHPQRLKEAEEAEKAEIYRQRKAKAAAKKGMVIASIAAAVIALVLVTVNVIIPAVKYFKAGKLLASGDYDGAIAAFAALGDYKDSDAMRVESANAKEYAQAEQLLAQGENVEAAIAFEKLAQYKDARERSFALWDTIAVRETLAAGNSHTVGLKTDGTVVAVGWNSDGRCDVSGWTDIVAVAAGCDHTVGLKSDGTVVAVGDNGCSQCDVSGWRDIVAVAAGDRHTVGLKVDGTVVAVGDTFLDGRCDVSGWRDIVAVAAGGFHTIGLKADGTVVAVGGNRNGQCDVSSWRDIVAVAAGCDHTVGLKSDGTVIAVGSNQNDQCDVSDWTDIVAVSAGDWHTVGLKADGTVVAVGDNEWGQCDVSGWRDIVAVVAGDYHTVGLKADGTVVAVGDNTLGQYDVSGWTDIKLPN